MFTWICKESPSLTLNFVTTETYTNISAEQAWQNQGNKGLGQNTQVLSSLIYIVWLLPGSHILVRAPGPVGSKSLVFSESLQDTECSFPIP